MMKLTKDEINVLTLLDDVRVNGVERFVKEFLDIPEKEINKIIKKLEKEKLIGRTKIPQGDEEFEWYFYTEKVDREKLNDNLRYERDYGKYVKLENVGSQKFGNFETNFFVTPKVRKFLEKEQMSLAVLIPSAYEWFELILFEQIRKKNTNFKTVYFGIINNAKIKSEKLVEEGFEENFKVNGKIIFTARKQINGTPKNLSKSFQLKFSVFEK